jgi:hypothetical protein
MSMKKLIAMLRMSLMSIISNFNLKMRLKIQIEDSN